MGILMKQKGSDLQRRPEKARYQQQVLKGKIEMHPTLPLNQKPAVMATVTRESSPRQTSSEAKPLSDADLPEKAAFLRKLLFPACFVCLENSKESAIWSN